ncbi:large ribosomal subunit protein bL19m [Calliphora vicina]|uniref:large ribosomal subunit protein bL19m n=1 Tax=Calliphora vicina TaxID=7373 RepID=UPI00325AD8A4
MISPARLITPQLLKQTTLKRVVVTFSTKPQPKESFAGNTTKSSTTHSAPEPRKPIAPPTYRFIYPEFLPDPKVEWRNPVREKLERLDMIDRRNQIEIPEFYVGSILAVTSTDPHSAGKVSRFVGICILRERCGLRARFILRNVIDEQGVEVMYEMYDPSIQKIEVLRLEKRLDDHLLYLRDALPEYSTFDINMEPEIMEEDSPVPVNEVQVRLRPRPWLERWERQNLKGVANVDEYINEKNRRKALQHEKPWEKFDLMKQYRSTIPEDEQKEIFAEVYSQLHQMELQRKRNKRKRSFVKPTKLA